MRKTLCLLTTALVLLVSCTSPSNQTSSLPTESFSESTQSIENSGNAQEETSSDETNLDAAVPNFTLTSSTGEEVSLEDFRGKTVVLNFWASWCPPCKQEMPDFQKLYEEQNQDEVVVLMLDQLGGRETQSSADQYIEENGFTFPVLYDEGSVGYMIFGITSLPTTVVVDKNGNLSSYVIGMTNYDTVLKMIEEAQNVE